MEKWAGDQRRKVNDGYGAWLDMAIFAAGDALDADGGFRIYRPS